MALRSSPARSWSSRFLRIRVLGGCSPSASETPITICSAALSSPSSSARVWQCWFWTWRIRCPTHARGAVVHDGSSGTRRYEALTEFARSGVILQQKPIEAWASLPVTIFHGTILGPCRRLARRTRVSGSLIARREIDAIAAQILASRRRYLQLVASAEVVLAKADTTLRAAPALHSSTWPPRPTRCPPVACLATDKKEGALLATARQLCQPSTDVVCSCRSISLEN